MENKIISDYDKNWLAYKTLQQDFVTNEYLRNESDENFKYIAKKFFPSTKTISSIAQAKLLNVGSGLFQNIAETYSYYVGNPMGDLDINLNKATKDWFSNGYMVLGVVAVDSVYSIERIPSNLHFYDYDLQADVVLRLYSKGDGNLSQSSRYLLQTIYRENRIENNLYKLGDSGDYNNGVLVPLDTINDTKNLNPVEQTTIKPLWIIKEDYLEQHPISEADKIKPIVYSIDRKTVMFDTQFLKNVESYKIFSGIPKPKEKNTGYTDFSENGGGRVFFGGEDAKVTFASNMNELITEAIEYESSQVRRLSSITKIPTDFMGLDNAHGAIGEGSRSILHGAFIKKIQYIRDLYDDTLRDLYEIVAKKNGLDTKYTRPDIYTKDTKELLEELILAKENKIISHTRSVMEYLDVSKEQAEQEIKESEKQSLLDKPQDAGQTPIGEQNNQENNPNDGNG